MKNSPLFRFSMLAGALALALPLAASAQVKVGLTLASTGPAARSEEHTSELQSLMRISYAVFCLKKKKKNNMTTTPMLKSMELISNTSNGHEKSSDII